MLYRSRLTTQTRCLIPATLKGLLDLVNKQKEATGDGHRDHHSIGSGGSRKEDYWSIKNQDIFGNMITKKDPNILRVGFQNIGGFSTELNKLKDDIIRCGMITWEFDIFGFCRNQCRLAPSTRGS
jgi:hypothetical protein